MIYLRHVTLGKQWQCLLLAVFLGTNGGKVEQREPRALYISPGMQTDICSPLCSMNSKLYLWILLASALFLEGHYDNVTELPGCWILIYSRKRNTLWKNEKYLFLFPPFPIFRNYIILICLSYCWCLIAGHFLYLLICSTQSFAMATRPGSVISDLLMLQ